MVQNCAWEFRIELYHNEHTNIKFGRIQNEENYLQDWQLPAQCLLSTAAMTTTASAECGSIKMAEFNWASGELMAQVDKYILEKGYGCEIELVVGGTTAIFASMNEKGVPQIAGEQWVNASTRNS